MTSSQPPPIALRPLLDVEPSGTLHCGECRYDLTGLDRGGQCPECATPIHESVAIDLLRTARGGPVLRGAMRLLFGCLTARAIISVVKASITMLLVTTAAGGPFSSIYLPLIGTSGLLGLLWLVEMVAWFRASSRAVTDWFRGADRWARLVRWGLLVELGVGSFMQAAGLLGFGGVGGMAGASAIAAVLLLAAHGALVAYLDVLGNEPRIGKSRQSALWIVYWIAAIVTVASLVTRAVAPASALLLNSPAGMGRWLASIVMQIALLGALSQRVRAIARRLK